ncbi:MAG: pyruvate formate lyase family protein [Sedimentisphaeraceae bacterium JB056]
MQNTDISTLREKIVSISIEGKAPCSPAAVISRRGRVLAETDDISPWQKRQGINVRKTLERLDFDFAMGIRLAGWQKIEPEITAEEELIFEKSPLAGGQTGHCQIYYDDILSIGINGIKKKIVERVSSANESERTVLESFLDSLEGLSKMIENAGSGMDVDIAERCRYISVNPPRDFRDAIQLIWLLNLGVSASDTVWCLVPGRLDRALGKFYTQDILHEKVTREEVLELIEEFYLLINYTYTRGLAYSIMVGGKDENGCDTTNEFSYLCFEALRRTKLVYPTVGLCWHEKTPQSLIDLAVELVCNGYTTPAFFGDDIITKGLMDIGLPIEEACNYINSACVEITPCNSSNIWVASPYFNTCGILLEEIAAEVEGGDVSDSFEEFLSRYIELMSSAIKEGVKEQNEYRRQRQEYGGKPLQSVFTLDCIERAKDIDDGGARYNQVECSFVGLANLIDSLYVIREEVFNGEKTLKELKELLDSNFKNSQEDALRFRNAYPKYGHGSEEVDSMFRDIVEALKESCLNCKVFPDNSEFLPGAFCWEMHTRLGKECGATPDGRLAATPFADGAGPAQGRETLGPTAAILSTTSWDHSSLLGGVAYNMRFNKSQLRSQAERDKLKTLIITYLERNGFEVQINVLDSGILEKALESPEDYADLVVRIGGYTDYFTRLIPEMQSEVIQRMEFDDV